MKTLDLRKATRSLASYAQDLGKEALVVVKNGKPVAVLASARGMDKESIAVANNPKFARIINRSRARHAASGGVGISQVYKRLGIKPMQKRPKRKGS